MSVVRVMPIRYRSSGVAVCSYNARKADSFMRSPPSVSGSTASAEVDISSRFMRGRSTPTEIAGLCSTAIQQAEGLRQVIRGDGGYPKADSQHGAQRAEDQESILGAGNPPTQKKERYAERDHDDRGLQGADDT